MRAAGLDPEVVVSGVDESSVTADSVAGLTGRLARLKAEAVATGLEPDRRPTVVIGCDSLLELDGAGYGKPGRPPRPRNAGGGCAAGPGCCTPATTSCCGATATEQSRSAVASTTVHFADLSDAEIGAYVATGEPLQVAGAFTVDGLGGPFVTAIEGDHHNVVGISLPLLRDLLADLGVAWPELCAG